MSTATTPSTEELAADRTELAFTRTMLSAERSLMAWIRTSLSMHSFGFTVYKVLQAFQASGDVVHPSATPESAGLFLTATGTIALVAGVLEFRMTIRGLLEEEGHVVRPWRPSLVLAALMIVGGVTLFVGIATGWV